MDSSSLAALAEIAKDAGTAAAFVISAASIYCARVAPPPAGSRAASIYAVINWLGQNFGYAANAASAGAPK
jgi:hypothetical protein